MAVNRGPIADLSWVQIKRLEFLDFRLAWYGRVNRGDLQERFGISAPQAGTDVEKYREIAPGNLEYDPAQRTFLRAAGYTPVFVDEHAERHLRQMEAIEQGVIDRAQTWFGELPPLGMTSLNRRPPDAFVLRVIIDAIREGRKAKVAYWTMSGKPPTERVISPHAFGHGAGRWHVRAYNEGNQDFRDFNLNRMTGAELLGPGEIGAELDFEWSTFGNLRLVVNPGLSPERLEAVRHEFRFEGSFIDVPCRLALLFYMNSEFGLRDKELPAERRPLLLDNYEELEQMRQNARLLSSNAIARRIS